MKRWLSKTALIGIVLAFNSMAMAQERVVAAWPNKPLKILVITAPGGFPDFAARTVGRFLAETLGQPVVVENRIGAGGNIAAKAVAQSEPDGLTLLVTGNNHAVNKTLLPDAGFDYDRDLIPVSWIGESAIMMVASPALKVKSLSDVIARAKSQSRSLSIAISAIGTPNHLGAELLDQLTNMKLVMVPYNGIAPALPDLMAGRVDLTVGSLPALLPLVQNGDLTAITIADRSRSEFAPEVPSSTEAGLPGFTLSGQIWLLTTGGTPAPIVQRLSSDVQAILKRPDVKEMFTKQGVQARASTPKELEADMKEEADKWAGVLAKAKTK
jgi:tripartite-type tricarboxylate transporter receptor subunit TctC